MTPPHLTTPTYTRHIKLLHQEPHILQSSTSSAKTRKQEKTAAAEPALEMSRVGVRVRVTRAGQSSPVKAAMGMLFDNMATYEDVLSKALSFGSSPFPEDVVVVTVLLLKGR